MSGKKTEDSMEEDSPPASVDVLESFKLFTEHLEHMDIPDNLSLETDELMSSEFFDTALLLETGNFDTDFNSDNVSSSNVDSDFAASSDPEELSYNYSPVSASTTFMNEITHCTPVNNNGLEIEANSNVSLLKKRRQSTTKVAPPPIKVPARIIVNNPNGKKVIVTKPIVKSSSRRSIPNTKHLLKVQAISGNGRSVVLPFDVANMKIVKRKELSSEGIQISKPRNNVSLVRPEDTYNSASSPDSVDNDSDSIESKCSRQYPVLVLTDEEKKLLNKDGIQLPTHYPLSKNEDKELKRIRRKIRNKISAQDSRKRRKEYVDGLENKLKHSSLEKKDLLNRIKLLQNKNRNLTSHLQKLQALVFNTSKATPTTCLLIVLMSALLISLPNLSISKGKSAKDEQQVVARRTLLSSQRAINEDNGSLDEYLMFNSNRKRPRNEADVEEVDACLTDFCRECNCKHKLFLQTGDIQQDVQSTIHTISDFLNNQFYFGNKFNEGMIIGDREVSKKFPRSNNGVALQLLDLDPD